MEKKEEKQIKVPESDYRELRRLRDRQRRAKRLIYELWLLYSNVKIM